MSSNTPSTYASVIGENPMAKWFIDHLGLTFTDFGRFRDVSLFREDVVDSEGKGIYVIRVITRNAGSRLQFREVNARLEKHPLFIRKELDDPDPRKTEDVMTYLNFFFAMPESMSEELKLNGVNLDFAYRDNDTFIVDNRDLKTKFSTPKKPK